MFPFFIVESALLFANGAHPWRHKLLPSLPGAWNSFCRRILLKDSSEEVIELIQITTALLFGLPRVHWQLAWNTDCFAGLRHSAVGTNAVVEKVVVIDTDSVESSIVAHVNLVEVEGVDGTHGSVGLLTTAPVEGLLGISWLMCLTKKLCGSLGSSGLHTLVSGNRREVKTIQFLSKLSIVWLLLG